MKTTTNPATETRNEVVFSMGLPAAGKSTWINANLAATHSIIDPDAVKEAHPDYDPKNPAALHAWSKTVTETMWADCVASGAGLWVVDGTGTNSEKLVQKIHEAQAAGYTTRLVYVECSLATSLARNAARARNVPEDVVREKAHYIATAFGLVAPHADSVTRIDNN